MTHHLHATTNDELMGCNMEHEVHIPQYIYVYTYMCVYMYVLVLGKDRLRMLLLLLLCYVGDTYTSNVFFIKIMFEKCHPNTHIIYTKTLNN